jgi:hypothetical protein
LRQTMIATRTLVVLLAFVAALGAPESFGQVATVSMVLDSRPEVLASGHLGTLILSDLPPGITQARGSLVLRDGKENRQLRLIDGKADDSGRQAQWTLSDGLAMSARLLPRAGHLSLVLSFTNEGEQQRWLEPGVSLDLSLAADWHFWDGLNIVAGRPGLTHKHDTLPAVFPAAALLTPGAGVFVGIEPMQLLSYLCSSVTSVDRLRAELEYVTRIVVDPGSTEQVEFVLGAVDGKYGHLAVLQRYCDEFPHAFALPAEADTRLTLAGARSSAWNRSNPGMYRRTYSGWEWEYAPFKRTGDIYGHREFWNYRPPSPITGNRAFGYEQFHQWRKDVFRGGVNSGVAMLFYVPSGIWVEEQLAQRLYPEACLKDEEGRLVTKVGYVTGYDTTCRVFPFGNGYAEVLREDMRLVVEELDMQGFAFDVSGGGIRVYADDTQGVTEAPGRAYDERGVFVDEGVGIALLMEYARSLEKDGRPMLIVANPSADGVYMTLVRSDAAMFEAAPWGTTHGMRPEHLRSRFGQKTLSWWRDWDHEAPLSRAYGPEALKEAFLGKVDYLILKSIELGVLPNGSAYVQGVPPLGRVMPMLVELIRAGRQPVPAICGASQLWYSRYGRAGRSYVTVGNGTTVPFEGELSVDNPYLGDTEYLFTHFDGTALYNVVQDRVTRLSVAIPSREYFVGRAALGLLPVAGDAVIGAWVSQAEDLASVTTRVEFDRTSPQTVTFFVDPPLGYSLSRVTINGRNVVIQGSDGIHTFREKVSEGDVLEVRYVSDSYRLSRESLLSFAFVSQPGGSQTMVKLPDDPSEKVLYAAYRLQKYFTDYIQACRADCQGVLAADGVLFDRATLVVPPQVYYEDSASKWHLVTFSGEFQGRMERQVPAPAGDRARIILDDALTGPEADGVVELRDGGRTLFVGAGDGDRLVELLIDMLNNLDAKYSYFGPLVNELQAGAPSCF